MAFAFLFILFAFDPLMLASRFGFIPAPVITGTWRDNPLIELLSPLASRVIEPSIVGILFNGVFLLIAGRYVERAIGPVGLIVVFVAGGYLGALARLALTPLSVMPSMGMTPSLFAVIGAYLMLYGVPRAIPVAPHHSRMVQIAIVVGIWAAIQVAFMLASGSFELSVSLVEPLGGLMAGLLLAQPMLKWRYRKA
jgi:membrane associated rhomboid family serine protease